MRRGLSTVALVVGVVLDAGLARAQAMTPFERNIDVQAFRPAPGPYNFLTVAGARVGGHLAPSVSGFVNYSFRPFTIYNAACPNPDNDDNCRPGEVRSRPIEHLVTANILASLTLFNRLQLAVDVPLSFETGDNVRPDDAMRVMPPNPTSQSGFALSDPRIYAKVRLAGEGLSGPAVAAEVFGQIPIGRHISSNSFLGDSSVGLGGRVIGDFRRNRFSLAANAGFLWRAETAQILSSYVGSRILWGLAGGYDITPRLTALVEVFGSTDLRNPEVLQQNAAEIDAAARFRLGDIALTGGAGTGILRGVGVPLARVFLGASYAPYRVDTDRDGVFDDVDRCVNEPEDHDGYEDHDGCPETDNDADGLADVTDRCPDEPEDRDNFQDQDGCPDRDNDNDGVPDGYDSCPREPEDRDGDRDDDGCPDNDRDRDGITDDRDRCVTEPEDTDGFQDEDGCPDPDNDEDGIPDTQDQCGEERETFNTYQDDDGCPDQLPDRDHDGITDDRDRCPDQPETYNGTDDEDGCPERGRPLVSLEGDQIRILQQVNFATNSDRIVGARSFQVLDAVVAVLRAHPEIAHVEIQGHTDNRGNAEHNRDLSQRRANAVRAYLISRGIEESRLSARGYGPDRPLESNSTARGRARNRRVEFHIMPASTTGAASSAGTVPSAPTGGAGASSDTAPAAVSAPSGGSR